jgi:hypothetical protein
MNPTYFGNKKSLQIVSSKIKDDIKTSINKIGSFNLTSKYYTFLNKKNVNNLKDGNFQVSLSTFGKKFILYMTTYNSKKYCIFINKKNDSMTVTQLKFSDDIFTGTLFDGELVKNNNDKWIYLINDIAYYKGDNIVTKQFSERQLIIENILSNDHEYSNNETLYISKKNYFEYKYIKDLSDKYMNTLNYKCAGLYFKNINNFSDNYLFIFPECRSDTKILNNGTTVNNDISEKLHNFNNNEQDDLFNDVEIIKSDDNNNNFNNNFNQIKKQKVFVENNKQKQKDYDVNSNNNHSIGNNKLEKTTCRFLINSTLMPDIYELYAKSNNNNIEKYSYASVPDIDTSNFLKNILSESDINEDIDSKIKNNKAVYVECNYHKSFKKWIPFKKVDSMDNISNINQIQIILDSV